MESSIPYAVETNTHTVEQRLHTRESLMARLQALGVPATVQLAFERCGVVETAHAIFRSFDAADQGRSYPPHIMFARPTGAWGLETHSVRCELCAGKGELQAARRYTDDAVEKLSCWECQGTGVVLVQNRSAA